MSNPPAENGLLGEAEIIAASVPTDGAKCGIYFLIKDGELKYIGQSINVDARLGSHHHRGFNRWHWVPCRPGELNSMERRYIDALLPPWNVDNRTEMRREELARPPRPPSQDEIERSIMARLRRAASTLE